MDFIRINNPFDVSWYHHLLDLMLLTGLIIGIAYSVQAFRRGRRDYAVLMVAGFFYGLILELSGMVWHHSYTQGEFLVMFDFQKFALFAQSTSVPAYVPILYPTLLFLAYKLVESFGIVRPWQRAVSGGAIMALLDAPYAIQGALPHVVWWTWREWEMYQFWMDWPLLDLWWRLTWDSLVLWIVYRSTPLVDSWYGSARDVGIAAHVKALLALPLGIGIGINIVGPLLHVPVAVPTMVGAQQAPFVALLAVVVVSVFVFAEKRPRPRPELVTVAGMGLFIASMSAMVVGNVLHEGRFTDYAIVQSIALAALGLMVAYPALAPRSPSGSVLAAPETMAARPGPASSAGG